MLNIYENYGLLQVGALIPTIVKKKGCDMCSMEKKDGGVGWMGHFKIFFLNNLSIITI